MFQAFVNKKQAPQQDIATVRKFLDEAFPLFDNFDQFRAGLLSALRFLQEDADEETADSDEAIVKSLLSRVNQTVAPRLSTENVYDDSLRGLQPVMMELQRLSSTGSIGGGRELEDRGSIETGSQNPPSSEGDGTPYVKFD